MNIFNDESFQMTTEEKISGAVSKRVELQETTRQAYI